MWTGLRFSADLNVAVIGVWRSSDAFWKKPLPPVRTLSVLLGCNDGDRADAVLSGIVGKRLTYQTASAGV